MIVRDLIAQGDLDGRFLSNAITASLAEFDIDRLDVAVAYATRPGLTALRDALGGWPQISRWVIGLDDAITQPAAIDDLIALPNSEVCLASLSAEGRRFHPKLYCLWSSNNPSTCLAIIGSANMTLHGLNRNGEVGVVLVAETEEEAETLKAGWAEMRALGRDHSEWDLEAYRGTHDKARRARRRMERTGAMPPHPEIAEEAPPPPMFDGNPSTATVAWTEGASPSAGGRDLEFPRAMMPFFGLTGSPTTKRFRMRNGVVFPLTFTMRTNNQMWRLLFSSDATQAGIGRENLRPANGLSNRSDLAIVFRKAENGADYEINLIEIGTAPYNELVAQTQNSGVLERTRNPGGRFFGYY